MMKHTKRLLALLLALVLALSLALPAMAVSPQSAINWDDFYIIRQPQSQTIRYGDSFTLSVEVNVPAGAEVRFQWRRAEGGGRFIENATSSELHISPGDPHYPEGSSLGGVETRFEVWITAYVRNDNNDIVLERRISSNSVRVQTEQTLLGRVFGVTIMPFSFAFAGILSTAPVSIPLLPLSLPFFLIWGFVEGFRGLFR